MDSKWVEVGALWIKEKEGGKQYLSGKLKVALPLGTALVIAKNEYKKTENQPDYRISAVFSEELPPYDPEGPKKVIAAVQAPIPPIAQTTWEDDVPF